MHRLLLFFCFLLVPSRLMAQPTADWQQEVAYEMDVRLDTDRHHLTGQQRLVYTNHSPDTLRHVYYHLYFNAFHPRSEMARHARRLPDPDSRIVPRIFNLEPDEIGYQRIRLLTQDGVPVSSQVSDTILDVTLARPLPPNASTVLDMAFEAQVPLQTRRSGRDNAEGIDYTMTQWYPKLAAYDARGWHAEPYVGREFYAPFGTFDVQITLPAAYVLGATGVLQNAADVGHGYDQPPDIGVTTTGPARSDSLTWHFRAKDVHDFAWTADPDYRHAQYLIANVPGRTEPVALHFLYQPDVAERWRTAPDQTAAFLRFYSAAYGTYAYPQFTVAQGGDGGMEYPMFTAVTGRRSIGSLAGVIRHELAHMWFYGMLGSDEVAYAWQDEGFASFASTNASAYVHSKGTATPDFAGTRERIAETQRLGLYEPPSSDANALATNLAYSVGSYTAGTALLDLLGYVMGDAVRDDFLRTYVERLRFRNPQPADVRAVAEATSGLRLGWLFDQFLDEGARYDYSIAGLGLEQTASFSRSTVTLQRRAPGLLPVELLLRDADGTETLVLIPLAEADGHRAVSADWTVAQPWAADQPNYTLTVEGSRPLREAVLDPRGRMIDVDASNNRAVRGGRNVPLVFSGFYADPPSRPAATTWAISSITTFSADYGAGVGAQLRTTSPYGRSTLQLGLTLWPAVLADDQQGFGPALPSDPIGGTAHAATPFDGVDYTAVLTRRAGGRPLDVVRFDAQKHLGIVENRVVLSHALGRFPTLRAWEHTLRFTLGHQHRMSDRAFETYGFDTFDHAFSEAHVLSARMDFDLGDAQNTIAAFVEVGGGLGGDAARDNDLPAGASRVALTASKTARLGPFAGIARLAAGAGLDGLAPQKRFGLGIASPESRWRSHAYRVLAAVPDQPRTDAHFLPFSGVGPVAYGLAASTAAYLRTGTRLLAGTLSLDIGPIHVPGLEPEMRRALAPLRIGLFSGIGSLGAPGGPVLGEVVADAGFRLGYDLPAFSLRRGLIRQSDVLSGLRLRAMFPLWVSHPKHLGPDESALSFRWLIGVETGL